MGNVCQQCLKYQIKNDQSIIIDISEGQRLNLNSQKSYRRQVLFFDTLFSIQSESISQLDVHTLIVFVDRPEAVLKNVFIQKLGISAVTQLKQKIIKQSQNLNNKTQFSIKIRDPFNGLPIKKLAICEVKVWDGTSHHNEYLKNVIQKQLSRNLRAGNKIALGIMQIPSILGYNLSQYYKILMRKLKQYSNRLNGITYITLKKKQVQKFLQEDYPNKTQTDSQKSQKSNYF